MAVLGTAAACGRAGSAPPASPSLGSSRPAPAAPSLAQATDVVQRYTADLSGADTGAAYGLWAPAWQAAHSPPSAAAQLAWPAGATADLGTPQPSANGTVYVPVRAVSADGRHFLQGGFRVGLAGAAAVLVGGGLQSPLPLQVLQRPSAVPLVVPQKQEVDCGGYLVRWSIQPNVPHELAAGATTTLTITGPGGQAIPPPVVSPFSFGTYPTYCGDLLGDGSVALVLNTATTSTGIYHQASIYLLGTGGVRLVGQMASVGDGLHPAPKALDGMYPYEMVAQDQIDDLATGEVEAPVVWAYSQGLYREANDAYAVFWRTDAKAHLATVADAKGCAKGQSFLNCHGADLVLTYYDDYQLGESGPARKALAADVPAADRGWISAQADMIDWHLAVP